MSQDILAMLKVFKILTIVFIAQYSNVLASERPSDFERQDTIRRVAVKVVVKEIPVDYNRAFQEASPVEKKAAYSKSSKKVAAPAPALVVKKPVVLRPVNVKIAAAKPILKPKISGTPVANKVVAKPIAPVKVVVTKAAPIAKPKPAAIIKAKPVVSTVPKKPIYVHKPEIAKVEAGKVSEQEMVMDEDGTKPLKTSEFSKFQKSIASEQAQWDSLANAQLDVSAATPAQNLADSKMDYLYIGLAITIAGVVCGLFFGRPAFLLSVVGVVFVLIGLFIHP